ncbi:MAG: response regulator transcription factor [Planctomycetota bacterium]
MRILVVEDYGPIRGAIVTALRDEGWTVELAGDGTAALDMLRGEQPFDLVILDLMLPGMDGPTLLKAARAEGIEAHVLVVTARDEIESRVAVLDAGADDYLVKPFAMEELVARARALLRRHYARKSPLIEVGPLSIRTTDHRVMMGKEVVDLTAREYALLEYFAYRAGEIVSREELHANLYGGGSGSASSNVVDVYVGYLRKKLEARGEARLLHTRRGAGYLLASEETSDTSGGATA